MVAQKFALLFIGLVTVSVLLIASAGCGPSSPIVYAGTTDQNTTITVTVKPDRSAVTHVELSFQTICDGETVDFREGYQTSPKNSFAVDSDGAFEAEAPYVFEVDGTFKSDFSAITGTWQGILGLCTGLPGPCYEQCRGPLGQWTATRQ